MNTEEFNEPDILGVDDEILEVGGGELDDLRVAAVEAERGAKQAYKHQCSEELLWWHDFSFETEVEKVDRLIWFGGSELYII